MGRGGRSLEKGTCTDYDVNVFWVGILWERIIWNSVCRIEWPFKVKLFWVTFQKHILPTIKFQYVSL